MKVLAVIDMQNDFVDGALGTAEAEGIVEDVRSKTADTRNRMNVLSIPETLIRRIT